MKFGKRLSVQVEETIPEWRDQFLSYKDLKKRLKLIVPRSGGGDAGAGGGERCCKRPRLAGEDGAEAAGVTEEEAEFIRLLEDEIDKFNAFFVEKEEEYIIRQKVLLPSSVSKFGSIDGSAKIFCLSWLNCCGGAFVRAGIAGPRG